MNISRFFIDRPIFAAVISVFITLIGIFAYPLLPLAQYPEIAPPTIAVTATYPGASAEVLAETVAAPLEQEINGVDDMMYMTSSSTADGVALVQVTFRQGTDLDKAQVQVQNRVALAEPRLPEDVRRLGVVVNKQWPGFLVLVSLSWKEGADRVDEIGNYASTALRDRLLRTPGVGEVNIFGGGYYSMRIWIDPGKAAARNLTVDEITSALRSQNVTAAGGSLGQAPFDKSGAAYQVPVDVQGRLQNPEQFGEVVLRTAADGRTIRLRDVARIELGPQDYGIRGYLDGKRTVHVAVIQQPGSNALETAQAISKTMEEVELPPGVSWSIPYNPSLFVKASVEAVQQTLLEAMVLVVLVVLVFLQTWRAAIIPILAMVVSLVGALAVQLALGYSLNSLSLFALVLAVGIVVDDAIVVVEAVERHMREGLSPREAAYRTMEEVSGALIAIGLVLLAVFVPTAFMPGIPGMFYRQFAVTISAATALSLLVSLTLSPALSALLLKPHAAEAHGPKWLAPVRAAGARFNGFFDWLSDRYGRFTARVVRATAVVLFVYFGLIGLTAWRLTDTPTGFIPDQDQGYLIGVVQLPPGSSLERTDATIQKATAAVMDMPGVDNVIAFSGFDGASFTASANAGVFFVTLDDWSMRGPEQSAVNLAGQAMGRVAPIDDAAVFFLPPAPVDGLGSAGGFKMMVQDRSGAGYAALEQAANALVGAAAQSPQTVQGVFSQFNTGSPRLVADVDRERALMLGVQPSAVFNTLGSMLGSTYVNDFNFQGRTYRVTAQAEAIGRNEASDVAALKVRTDGGGLAPVGSVATLRDGSGPHRVVRFNMFPAAEVQGVAAPGVASGSALASMEELAAKALPPGFGFEWTELAYEQKAAGDLGGLVFVMAVLLVFMVLAAQYESLTLPLAVILIVPMCLLAALIGVNLRGQDNNILTQIGLLVLVALAAKNAILIVEFAKQAEDHDGADRFEAAVQAARTRLRPILMTSFAFILGVLPLAIAHGPGAEMRQALGTAVFFGMIGVTAFGLIFTPAFYVMCRRLSLRFAGRKAARPPATVAAEPEGGL